MSIDGQGTLRRRNIAESPEWGARTLQTDRRQTSGDRRQTDGRTTTCEREREFTFAKNQVKTLEKVYEREHDRHAGQDILKICEYTSFIVDF